MQVFYSRILEIYQYKNTGHMRKAGLKYVTDREYLNKRKKQRNSINEINDTSGTTNS